MRSVKKVFAVPFLPEVALRREQLVVCLSLSLADSIVGSDFRA